MAFEKNLINACTLKSILLEPFCIRIFEILNNVILSYKLLENTTKLPK